MKPMGRQENICRIIYSTIKNLHQTANHSKSDQKMEGSCCHLLKSKVEKMSYNSKVKRYSENIKRKDVFPQNNLSEKM